MFRRLARSEGSRGKEGRGYVTRRDERRARGGEDKVVEDQAVGGGTGAVLGRCIVGVLAFNLTAQFH